MNVEIKAIPGNNSWYQFRQNWWKIITGTTRFVMFNPASFWPILKARLAFALLKRSVTKPVRTPEGFMLENNRELIVYSHIFIERNMYWRKLINEFKKEMSYPMPLHVLDVGANVGLFTQFMAQYRSNAVEFHLFEPITNLLTRAAQLNWNEPLFGRKFSRALLRHNSIGVGRETETIKTVNVGSIISPRHLDEQNTNVAEMPLTNLSQYCREVIPIFLLKIDTDGMNHDVLYGAKKILPRVLWVMVERDAEYEYCAEILHRFGFKHVGNSSPVDAVWYNGNAVVNWTHEFRQLHNIPKPSQPDLPNLNLESTHGGSC